MQIVVTEIIANGISEEKEVVWLKCKTADNKIIAFWGEFDNPNRNIAALKNQKLPVLIEILDLEDCSPTTHEKIKYNLDLSIPSDVYIQINPEH